MQPGSVYFPPAILSYDAEGCQTFRNSSKCSTGAFNPTSYIRRSVAPRESRSPNTEHRSASTPSL